MEGDGGGAARLALVNLTSMMARDSSKPKLLFIKREKDKEMISSGLTRFV